MKDSPRNMGLRLDPILSSTLAEFENSTGVEGTTLARNSLKAALTYWQQHGHISFPLVLSEASTGTHSTGTHSTGTHSTEKKKKT